ncbi:MAG: threonine-phosphate decarboxylase CobD [Hyphomicrobiaceae bacterium]
MHHGGDIGAARSAYGEPAEGWLDLSTGINPVAYPFTMPEPASWRRLPQAAAERRLLEAARAAYGVPDHADICAAPGTQILIQMLPRLMPGARVSVVGPTYTEHAATWRAEGAVVTLVPVLAEASGDVVVVVNPNNPDGRTVAPGEIGDLAGRLQARHGLVVVDEAFADVDSALSVVAMAGQPGLLVLRSFGKFYGLGGVRLGFAIGHRADIGRLRHWLGPWATSGPAIEIGAAALADGAWAQAMRAEIRQQSAALSALLAAQGFAARGNGGLFVLTEHVRAVDLHAALARRGIWVRRFADHPGWLRFGLPGPAVARLAAALAAAVDEIGGGAP